MATSLPTIISSPAATASPPSWKTWKPVPRLPACVPVGITYQLQDEQNQPGWTGFNVTLTVAGDYPDLLRFIHQLEQSDLFWIISGVSVAGSAERELRMSLQMQTYFIPS